MVTADWRNLDQSGKEKFEKEAQKVNEDKELNETDKSLRIDTYLEKLKRFQEDLQ